MQNRDHVSRGGNTPLRIKTGLLAASLFVLASLLTGCFGNSNDAPGGSSGNAQPSSTPEPLAPTFPGLGGVIMAPLRIDATESGWLLVTDPKRKSVHRVDPKTLRSVQSLHIEGTPLAVGMLAGKILVGVKEAHSIEMFSHTGTPIGSLSEPGVVDYPGDLAIEGTAGLVFVLDGTVRDVKIFKLADRSLVGTIGTGLLQSPSGLAVDPSRQEILVSDYGSSLEKASLKIISYAPETTGELVATMTAGSCGFFGCTGGFSRPRGLAVRDSRIFLSDALLGQVLIFDRATLLKVGELGPPDPALRVLRLPSDVSINAAGDVYVTSTLAKSIVVFPGGAL